MIKIKRSKIQPAYGTWVNDVYQKPLHERKGKRWLNMGGHCRRKKSK